MVSLLDLNDDCLWSVLEYCDFKTKLKVSNVCQRLKSAVEDLFKSEYKQLKISSAFEEYAEDKTCEYIIAINGKRCYISTSEFDTFLELIHTTTEKLELEDLPVYLGGHINKFNFANTHDLSVSCFSEDNPQALYYIRSAFQNLRTLRLDGEIWVRSCPQLYALENLDLRDTNISYENLIDIISRMKLKSLTLNCALDSTFRAIESDESDDDLEYLSDMETLCTGMCETKLFINVFEKMKKLKEFVISGGIRMDADFSIVNNKLASLDSRQVIELTLSNFLSFQSGTSTIINMVPFIQLFYNLKKLTLAYAKHDVIFLILNSSSFPVLEDLTLLHCSNLNIESIVDTMKDAPQLQNINFLHCSSSTRTVTLNKRLIAEQRTVPLTIRINVISKCSIFEQYLQVIATEHSDLVEVTEQPPDVWIDDSQLDFIAAKYILEQVED